MLTLDQNRERLQLCQEFLTHYSAEGNNFLFRIITGDESFLYYYKTVSKQLSKEWKRADSPPPTKPKQENSVGNVLYSYFWNREGIILRRPTPANVTIKKILCKYFSE